MTRLTLIERKNDGLGGSSDARVALGFPFKRNDSFELSAVIPSLRPTTASHNRMPKDSVKSLKWMKHLRIGKAVSLAVHVLGLTASAVVF